VVSGRAGRVRARVEAPVGASLLIRAGGQAMRFPLPLVLEGPQRSPPQAPAEVTVERVPWDAVSVSLGPGAEDGVVEPGAAVPVSVAFGVLAAEPSEVSLRCTAELRPARGGEAVWRHTLNQTVPANAPVPPAFALPLTAPAAEGTYVLHVRATWEPAPARDGGLFNRLIHRGKRGRAVAASASRRVTLAVLADKGEPAPARGANRGDREVDAIDLTRSRVHRASASGRAATAAAGAGTGGGSSTLSAGWAAWPVPDEALTEATRRDRLRGWIMRVGPEVARLGPADASGLAWSALGLKVPRPGRPHRLTLTVAAGHPAALGVALVGGGGPGPGAKPRLLLDACASGPPVLPDGPAATFSWLVWPDVAEPVLVLVNRATGSAVQVGSVSLRELAELPAGPAVETPEGAPTRDLGLYLTGAELIERFGGTAEAGVADALAAARSFGAYLASVGATAAVLPESLSDRPRRAALDGTAAEDAVGPDRLDLVLRVLARRKISVWLELAFDGPLPGLPDPASPEALARGLVRVDRQGRADDPPAYHPLSPEVGEAMRRRVVGTVAAHKTHANLAGVLVRLGPGPTLLGGPDTGFDDATFARFAREAFDPETAQGLPGAGGDDPGRFAARSAFLAGAGRMPWLTWRSRQVAALYAGLAEAVRRESPSASLAVATPGPSPADGPAGTEARRADLAGLAPSLAWRAVGLDLDAWPTKPGAPVVLRGVGLGPDDLAHDLGTNSELDARVAARPARGLLLGVDRQAADASAPARLALTAPPADDGPAADEPLGHALAALDPHAVWLAAAAVAGHEERVRQFARVYRAIPAAEPDDRRPLAFGVAVRSHRAGDATYLTLANDTPYPVRLDTAIVAPDDAPIRDLGRGVLLRPAADDAGRHLVLDLLPFGSAAVRIGSPGAKVASATPYPSDAVLTTLQTRFDALSDQLARLTRGGEAGGDKARSDPPNPGFEPGPDADADADAPARKVAMRIDPPGGDDAGSGDDEGAKATAPRGWKATGGAGAAVAIDPEAPRSGRGALRLNAPEAPASAVSDEFHPEVHSAMLVRAWFRADRPEARVKVWIEGQSAGKPYRRVSELIVPGSWAERAVRAADVPPGGLDSTRLRFELLDPGVLWVDDLSVSGEPLTEPERRNARNALLAALQAYREKRYADFARLAGSRWARHPGAAGGPAPAPERVASDRAGLFRTGDASAKPQGRRLR
jgi:hypothetical protein